MTSLFVSDLHLATDRPKTRALFLRFLETRARQADALYILGDLFEVWLGDDMILPDYQPVIQAMKALSHSGVALNLMHGNRDFFMGKRLAQLCGATLLDDPVVIELDGIASLLLHGDTLCIDDVDYMKFRSMVRNPQWQKEVLAKSPEQRLALARQFREISKTETGSKSEAIMDVNQTEVERMFSEYEVARLIHGHTHRPAIHDFEVDGQPVQRIVLGDWYTQGSVLVCEKGHCALETVYPSTSSG
ncbi:UDP-2,3-diacylglucosamine diphosphatase [hydrothermal vent metagenome]|uniref:UDP-2,3-diacylglucosamine diphosphatase n=1 Tax=hydrothermal vent metagenome TaxID=652676 RepID=A0A3B1B4G1_9ZZZZ